MTLTQFNDLVAEKVFGMKKSDALKYGICVACKRKVDLDVLKPIDQEEYCLSGICPSCFEEITK
jgi:hypothetical protein